MEEVDMGSVEDENMLDEIRGEVKKKPKMSILNQKKINKFEMDELFSEDDYEEEF